MSKSQLLQIFQDIEQEEEGAKVPSTLKKLPETVLLVDAMNLFYRNFAVMNYLNKEGSHVGGLGGFLRSLGAAVEKLKPKKVIVVFDGPGSSDLRKNLVPEYKSERGIRRVTNWDVFESVEEEDEAKVNQISRLVQYLHCLPVTQVVIPRAEADDVIAYLSQQLDSKGVKVTILSTDQDYLQLLTPNVKVYQPKEQVLITEQVFKAKHQILPENYILLKTVKGDSSDSIKGIKGIGEKTFIKRFPELQTQKYTLDQFLELCYERREDHPQYAMIYTFQEDIKKKYKVMDLGTQLLTEEQKQEIDEQVAQGYTGFFLKEFTQAAAADGIEHIIKNPRVWVNTKFGYLTATSK